MFGLFTYDNINGSYQICAGQIITIVDIIHTGENKWGHDSIEIILLHQNKIKKCRTIIRQKYPGLKEVA
jgi:hypothetical protein